MRLGGFRESFCSFSYGSLPVLQYFNFSTAKSGLTNVVCIGLKELCAKYLKSKRQRETDVDEIFLENSSKMAKMAYRKIEIFFKHWASSLPPPLPQGNFMPKI